MPIIGAHVSAAGGHVNAVSRAQAIGAQCLQIFGASPRTFFAKMLTTEDAEAFKKAQKSAGIGPVFLHAAYLVNLASSKADLRKKSVRSLSDHLKIADLLGAQGLIFHIGSAKDMTREEALEFTVSGMKEVLKNVPGDTELIMENTAGSGQKIGSSAEELGWLLKKLTAPKSATGRVHPPEASALGRVKVCVDTAHAFEAGVIEHFSPSEVKKFLDDYDKHVGFENISAFHVNDSKTVFNSRHDRHENIGEGYIGLAGFKNLARDKRMKNMPWILEVPGFDGEGPDKRNVEILKGRCI